MSRVIIKLVALNPLTWTTEDMPHIDQLLETMPPSQVLKISGLQVI